MVAVLCQLAATVGGRKEKLIWRKMQFFEGQKSLKNVVKTKGTAT